MEVVAEIGGDFPVEYIIVGDYIISASHGLKQGRICAADTVSVEVGSAVKAQGGEYALVKDGAKEAHPIIGYLKQGTNVGGSRLEITDHDQSS